MSAHHSVPMTAQTRLIALMIAVVAIIIIGVFSAVIGEWITTQAPLASKNPFSVGISEGGSTANGLTAIILTIQARFAEAMTAGLSLFKIEGTGLTSFIAIGFAYGIFHAAGPGHGKAVIAAYAFSREKAIGRTIGMASAAAALQTLVAISIVTVLSLIIRVTAPTMRNATQMIELVSFVAIALVGLALLWEKSKSLAYSIRKERIPHSPQHDHYGHHIHDHGHHHSHHTHDHDHDGHTHAPISPPNAGWKGMISAVIAAGIRPCSGSILILVFALSQNLFMIGILAAIAIGLGTAITTSGLAVFAILAKAAATKIAKRHFDERAALVGHALEVLAASFVFVLGLSLVMASMSDIAPNG